jgi:hypothetical protein
MFRSSLLAIFAASGLMMALAACCGPRSMSDSRLHAIRAGDTKSNHECPSTIACTRCVFDTAIQKYVDCNGPTPSAIGNCASAAGKHCKQTQVTCQECTAYDDADCGVNPVDKGDLVYPSCRDVSPGDPDDPGGAGS